MTTTGRLWRFLAGGAAIAAALLMAGVIDAGTGRQWAVLVKWSWLIGMFVLFFIGCGFLIQVGRPLLGESEMGWFPTRAEARRPTGILPVLGVGGIILGIVALVGLWRPAVVGRAALAGIGVLLLVLLTLRSRGLWDDPQVTFWREILGDRIVLMVSVAIALALIVVALVAR